MSDEAKVEYPTDEEFSSWDEEKEDEALAAFRDSAPFKVKTCTKGMFFFAKAPSGNTYRLPLALSLSNYSALNNVDDGTDPIEALRNIFREFCPEKVEELDHEPIQVVSSLLSEFGRVIAKTQNASLGE